MERTATLMSSLLLATPPPHVIFGSRKAQRNVFVMGMAGMTRKDLKCEEIFFFNESGAKDVERRIMCS